MPDDRKKLAPWVALSILIVFILLLQALIPGLFFSGLVEESVSVLVYLAPLWMPFVLGIFFWFAWNNYILARFLWEQKSTLLEIKLPQNIERTVGAAELMLTGLNITSGESNWFDRRWYGKRRPTFSLEIVSVGGAIHFYIWTRQFYKSTVEYAVYSQYPDVEITEVEDYALKTQFDPEDMIFWGTEFEFSEKPDAYPIKTYVDYGLDQPQTKEEQKVDPLVLFLEFLGNCNSGGQLWFQFIVQATKGYDTKHKKGTWFKRETWKQEAREEVDKLMRRDPKTKGPGQLSPSGFPIHPTLSEGERNAVEAIERSLNKPAFNVGIRGMYLSDRKSFNPVHIVGIIGCMKQFNAPEYNGLGPARWHLTFDYPWQDYKNIRANRFSRILLEYYKRRAYFYPPYQQKISVLTTEELATLFHFPGRVAATPTMDRVASKRAQPPANLPV